MPGRDGLGRVGDMAQATTLFDREDQPAFTLFKEQRIEVPLSQVAPIARKAILAIEDQRFYEHRGVDTIRIVGSAIANLRAGRRAQGGSTLTQQLARQSFLTRDKTLRRKLKEYYDGEESGETVRIEMPSPGYVPVFTATAGPDGTFPASFGLTLAPGSYTVRVALRLAEDRTSVVTLALQVPAGQYRAEWVNPVSGEVAQSENVTHESSELTLSSPAYVQEIALRLVKR
jgi:hypothetical protein